MVQVMVRVLVALVVAVLLPYAPAGTGPAESALRSP